MGYSSNCTNQRAFPTPHRVEPDCRAVDAHQPKAAIEGADGLVGSHRLRDSTKQRFQRLGAEPARALAGEAFVGTCRARSHPEAHDSPSTRLRHLLVGGISKQCEDEHLVDDDSSGHHAVDEIRGEDPCDDTDGDVVGKSLVCLRLHPSRSWHVPNNNTGVVLTNRYWA